MSAAVYLSEKNLHLHPIAPAGNSAAAVSPWRGDIDGLRAVCIVAVLVFHAFPSALPGGFIGVDVFFVISGYLITGLLLRRQEAGGIDVLAFYAARVRRIVPSLLVVLLGTLAAGAV